MRHLLFIFMFLYRLIRYSWILTLSVLTVIFFSSITFSQESYYWYKGRKISLTLTSEFTGIELRQNNQATRNTLNENGLITHGHFGQDGRMVVVQGKSDKIGVRITDLRREGKIVRSFNAFESTTNLGPKYKMIPFDEILVKFKPHLIETEIDQVISTLGLTTKNIDKRGVYLLRVSDPGSMRTIQMANYFYEEDLAEWSEPNFAMKIIPHDDSLYIRQWYLLNLGQIENSVPLVDIRAPHVWYGGTFGDSNIVVAVLDDGIESHEDLPASRLVTGWTAGWGGGVGTPSTGDAHGEAVAGIIGAIHNSIGIRGIAPGVKLMSIKIFSNLEFAYANC